MTYFLSALLSFVFGASVIFLSSVAGYNYGLTSTYKDCKEFGGATLGPGMIIECKVEVLK